METDRSAPHVDGVQGSTHHELTEKLGVGSPREAQEVRLCTLPRNLSSGRGAGAYGQLHTGGPGAAAPGSRGIRVSAMPRSLSSGAVPGDWSDGSCRNQRPLRRLQLCVQ